PEPAAHVEPLWMEPVAVVVVVIWTRPRMLPEETSPPAACTTSVRLLIVSVSCAWSSTLRTVYEQLYGLPTWTGLMQPFVKPMPCWVSADTTPAPTLSTTSVAVATAANRRLWTCMSFPPLRPGTGQALRRSDECARTSRR